MMRMAEMVKKMLNQKMPKMFLNQPLRTIAMVLVLALVLEQAEEEEEEETEEEDDDSEEDEETVAINGGEYSRKRKMTRGENFQDLIVVLIHRGAHVCVLLVFMICYYVLLFYFKDSIHT